MKNWLLRNLKIILLVSSSLGSPSAILLAANEIYRVTTLEDAGIGSFREAILNANEHPGSLIAFEVNGTLLLSAPLPPITQCTTIDGSTAPSFVKAPVVCVDFSNLPGLVVGHAADGSIIKSLSLIHALGAAITLQGSHATIAGNYIGLDPLGAVAPNNGDGIFITSSSKGNLIGHFDPVVSQSYFSHAAVPSGSTPNHPVTAWNGLRKLDDPPNTYLICGTSAENGLLYQGTFDGVSGTSHLVQHPKAASTIVYGLNDTGTVDENDRKILQLSGNYTLVEDPKGVSHGFLWNGTADELPSGGVWETIDYPHAAHQSVQSLMSRLAVGNAVIPAGKGNTASRSIAYLYDTHSHSFLKRITYPKSRGNTAFGIWHNGGDKYTICGGFSPKKSALDLGGQPINLEGLDGGKAEGWDPLETRSYCDGESRELSLELNTDYSACLGTTPYSRAYLVDFDASTGKFSNWTAFDYRNGTQEIDCSVYFSGVSSTEPGVYTMSANVFSFDKQGNPISNQVRGALATVRRNPDGTFGSIAWADIHSPNGDNQVKSNSVYGNHVVGVSRFDTTQAAYQATVNLGFQLSNVISGNRGNGITLSGSHGNVIAMNYIGSDPLGSVNQLVGNEKNGILITKRSSHNLIGGQVAGDNNPTGSKGTVPPVFFRPPQGNLISGNGRHGICIQKGSSNNVISGNYIGTDATGALALGNGLNGVTIINASHNSLLGCTFQQNPFVFYNVISGNRKNGVYCKDTRDTTIQANFIGTNCTNDGVIPNGCNGVTVAGKSDTTLIGGVIPLGNVVSGNAQNGIAVIERASRVTSFNTFGGIFAFAGVAPNGKNGLLITSTGGGNVARTNIFSGNEWNGIEIGGNASGVVVEDTACGLSTDFSFAIPNGMNGILIRGTAHDNAIGGFQPSIELRNHLAGNTGYGIHIAEGAHDNSIFGSDIGTALNRLLPNDLGGILLDQGTYATTIGGSKPRDKNTIKGNRGAGISLFSSQRNKILENEVTLNTEFGIYAKGNCNKTVIQENRVVSNGNSPLDNVQISEATGIIYKP